MPAHNADLEVLILGDLIVRRNGCEISLPPAPSETLTILAAYGRPVPAERLRAVHSNRPSTNSLQSYVSELKTKHRVPIVSARSGKSTTYRLDPACCRVDAAEFIAGVREDRDIDELLRLWRGGVAARDLGSPAWADVRAARTSLIGRIAALSLDDQLALTELARFTSLFPGDEEVSAVRPHGGRRRPRLLVVEDNPEMLDEIRSRLKADYDIAPVSDREEWRRDYLDKPEKLDLIDGALVDLHLTKLGNDFRGREIARHLRDHTEIPVALMTANSGQRRHQAEQADMHELRLVDIINKRGEEWYEDLEPIARLLVGQGVQDRQHRMKTWLAHTYRNVERDTINAAPNSIPFNSRAACYREYQAALALVENGDLELAEQAVRRFCATRWVS